LKVHNVDQRPNLVHLCEPLGVTEGLIKTVGFKKTTECMWWRTSANARRELLPPQFHTEWAVTLKPQEGKVVWTRGTDNRLVLEECW